LQLKLQLKANAPFLDMRKITRDFIFIKSESKK